MAGGILLQTAATTGNGNAWNFRGQSGEYGFSIQPTGTITAGAVQFEEGPTEAYSGTWAPIDGPITVQNGQLTTHKVSGSYQWVRARISTEVTGGGSVTVKVQPPRVESGA